MAWRIVLVLVLSLAGVAQTPLNSSAAPPKCFGREATIVGTNGRDTLNGTAGADVIVAKGGRDFVYGKGGDDLICLGSGRRGRGVYDDVVESAFGGRGNDKIDGGPDDDAIDGEAGADLLLGGGAEDTVLGNDGDDVIKGGW